MTSAKAEAGLPGSAESVFATGQSLVRSNCADCVGASADALRKGLDELARALDLGYSDRAAAFRLLAEGYGALAFAFTPPDTPEHRHAREAQREAYRHWAEAEPSNSEALYGHAVTIEDPAGRRAALERLVQVDPEHLWGQFLLGEMEIDSVASAMGLGRMQRAFEASEGADRRAFGERLIEAYERQGLAAEAQSVRDQLAELSYGP